MKTPFQFLAVLTALAFSFAPCLVRAQDAPPPPDAQNAPPTSDDQGDQSASFQTFYDQLSDQGNWVQTDDYGYVFQPNVSDPQWAPYTDGHWVYTDQGWAWVSDEPWGWATYHYGRWANIDGMGWVWVPGYRWAPAWVSWRYGGGYCGWAPLPPGTFIGVDYSSAGGFHFGGDVDVSFGIGPGFYNFISVGDMGEPNYRGHFLDRSRNFAVINNTTNITNINVGRTAAGAGNFRGVAVGGPTLAEVNAHARQHVQTVQLTASNRPGRSTLQGNSLAVYAPAVNPASSRMAKPARVSQTIAKPTFNRGVSITKPLAVTASVKPPAPTAEAIQAAKTAQLHAPATAKIATPKTKVKTSLNQPLTSLQAAAPTRPSTTATTPAANSFNGANTVNPNTEHSAANAPFTGEPAAKPAATFHPQNEAQPQTEAKPATTYHPQTQEAPAQTYRPQTQAAPTETYHPPTEEKPASTYHPQSTPAAQTYRPQTQEAPAQTFHPQSQPVVHEAPAPTHTEAAPVHSAPAPAAAAAPPPSAQGNKPAQGGGGGNPQGH